MKIKWRSFLGLGIFFLLFFFGQFMALRNHSQSFYFQDETEHVTLGWMMQRFDKNLYVDLSSNHQPLPILTGAVLSKFIQFNSLFQLIERIRLSMFAFTLLGSLLLTLRFKWRGLLSSILVQSVAYYYFGWHVLAESLAVPAIQFMLLALWSFHHRKKLSQQVLILDSILFGISSWWLVFSLLPLWPFVLIANASYGFLLYKKNQLNAFLISLGTSAILLVGLFSFISPLAWWDETMANLFKYFLPYEAAFTAVDYLKIGFYPFFNMVVVDHFIGRWFLFLVLTLTFYLLFKRQIWLVIISLLMLLLLNLRVIDSTQVFYTGFHLLPLMAGVSVATAVFSIELMKIKAVSKAGILVLLTLLLINNVSWWGEKKDKQNEFSIQYGTFQSLAHAINSIKKDSDRIFNAPNGHGYLNMMADLPIAGRQLFHLPWAYRSPKLKAEFEELMETNPPEFIYFQTDINGYSNDLKTYLEKDFIEIIRTNGDKTNLFMQKDLTSTISDVQQQQLEHYQYQLTSN